MNYWRLSMPSRPSGTYILVGKVEDFDPKELVSPYHDIFIRLGLVYLAPPESQVHKDAVTFIMNAIEESFQKLNQNLTYELIMEGIVWDVPDVFGCTKIQNRRADGRLASTSGRFLGSIGVVLAYGNRHPSPWPHTNLVVSRLFQCIHDIVGPSTWSTIRLVPSDSWTPGQQRFVAEFFGGYLPSIKDLIINNVATGIWPAQILPSILENMEGMNLTMFPCWWSSKLKHPLRSPLSIHRNVKDQAGSLESLLKCPISSAPVQMFHTLHLHPHKSQLNIQNPVGDVAGYLLNGEVTFRNGRFLKAVTVAASYLISWSNSIFSLCVILNENLTKTDVDSITFVLMKRRTRIRALVNGVARPGEDQCRVVPNVDEALPEEELCRLLDVDILRKFRVTRADLANPHFDFSLTFDCDEICHLSGLNRGIFPVNEIILNVRDFCQRLFDRADHLVQNNRYPLGQMGFPIV